MKNNFKKSNSLKKIVIIPSYHNTVELIKILPKFREKIVDEICIVIDQVTQNDLISIQKVAVKIQTQIFIISRKERGGIGLAIREGIKYAIKKDYDIAIIMAGNGKDQPEEIPRLLTPILTRDYDYVQGSRFLSGSKCVKNPFLRGIFSRFFPFIWSLFTRVNCTDVTNGFRAYKLNLFLDKRINIWQNWLDGYQLEYYLHYKVLTLGFRTKEVPVSKIYPFSHKGGYSKISPFRDWWQIIGPLIYLRFGIRY